MNTPLFDPTKPYLPPQFQPPRRFSVGIVGSPGGLDFLGVVGAHQAAPKDDDGMRESRRTSGQSKSQRRLLFILDAPCIGELGLTEDNCILELHLLDEKDVRQVPELPVWPEVGYQTGSSNKLNHRTQPVMQILSRHDGVILCYDVSDRASFLNMLDILGNFRPFIRNSLPLAQLHSY